MNYIEARDIFEDKGDFGDYILSWRTGKGEQGAIEYMMNLTGCDEVIAKNLVRHYGNFEVSSATYTDTTPLHLAPEPSQPTVQCPYCKSTNTHKITVTAKVVNTALFGLFGTKRNKQWHCDRCGSEW